MNKLSFKLRFKSALVCTLALLLSPVSNADMRVIITYNEVEHKLLRAIELPDTLAAPISDHLQSNSNQRSAPEDLSHRVKLTWFGHDGDLLSTTSIADPRLIHAPLGNADQAPSMIGLSEGAYMLTGPSDSAVLEIQLPASVVLGLATQFWRIMLVR